MKLHYEHKDKAQTTRDYVCPDCRHFKKVRLKPK